MSHLFVPIKRDNMSTEGKEDEIYRQETSGNGAAHSVDWTGAVKRFEPISNESNIRPKNTPDNTARTTSCDSSEDYMSDDSDVLTSVIRRRVNGVQSNNGTAQARRVTFVEPSYVEYDDGKNLKDDEDFKSPYGNGFGSHGDIDSLLMQMKNMQKSVRNLQNDVAKFGDSGSTGTAPTYVSHRRSDMVRTSLILKDIHFLSEEIQGSDSKFPADCYSLVALNSPFEHYHSWPREKILFFLFGLMVFGFQITFLVLMIVSRIYIAAADIDSDNPIDQFLQFIPANSKHVIRVSQVVALMTYVLFPDASLMDVFKAYQYYPQSRRKIYEGDPVKGMKLSCYLRGFQGYLATIAVFLVVITTRSVVDIILNFTALSFVSSLDDEAFDLAKSGVFGSGMRKEIERIENAKLPYCMTPQYTVRLYWKVMGSTAAVMFSLLFCVIGFQNSPNWWVTPTLRVEFPEETGLKAYSGCYKINMDSRFTNRFSYTHDDSGVAFGYCTNDERYVLFSDFEDDLNPCDAENVIARSSETEFFDIATTFEELWFYADTTTPVDLFFFPDSDVENLHCDMFMGDGKCDQPFNTPGYQYDNGDCCAATCDAALCGYGGYTSIFGSKNVSGNGYPYCKNPQMVPIVIQLNDIVSSRDPLFEVDPVSACKLDLTKGEDEWRAVPPNKPLLHLVCDDKFILTLNIEESMKHNNETVWVEDGADCYLGLRDTRSDTVPGSKDVNLFSFYCNDPIWLVNYTIFHGSEDSTESDPIEIVTSHSSEVEGVMFQRIPECYFSKLGDYVDSASIYSTSNPSYDVIRWLLGDDDLELLLCENELFLERFAIATAVFGMNGNVTKLDNGSQQCAWPWIECSDLGKVMGMNLYDSSLEGEVPSELIILKELEQLNLYQNQITSLPNEIGLIKNLEKLWLHDNLVTSIPSEIGLLRNLETLWLNDNAITYVPSEIGSLTNLRDLDLEKNGLASLPTEVGLMTSLEAFWLGVNEIKSIPTEIGLLADLEVLWAYENQISSLPSEFGLLTNLEAVSLRGNKITSIPTEMGQMKILQELHLNENNITFIPTEIGLMTSLKVLRLNDNQISSVPSEIGSLTNLKELTLHNNNNIQGASLPEEVEKLCAMSDVVCTVDDNSSVQTNGIAVQGIDGPL